MYSLESAIFISTSSCLISAFHCFHATNQITSHFGFRQGLRQRSVSREALGPRLMLKQQAADFKLVFILMEIINFEATWILNAIKIECSVFEVRFYDAY